MEHSPVSEEERINRILLRVFYPTRISRICRPISYRLYWLSEALHRGQNKGVFNWLGDRVDDIDIWSLRRRARRWK